jgi:hypothetical protein
VRVDDFQTGSGRKAEAALLEMLSAGEPVMLQVDMGYLPYFDIPGEFHFGGHAVVAAGLDAEARQVLLADRDAELHPVPLADLAKARASSCPPFTPRHHWYRFDFTGKRQPDASEIWQAIREVCDGMLNPVISNLGVKGIHKSSQKIQSWAETMGSGELRASLFNVFIFIDAAGGTGGGLFRYMYGRFLQEAAGLTGERGLDEFGGIFQSIGDRWQALALLMREASQLDRPEPCLPETAALIRDIAGQETSAWERLAELAAKI